MAILKKHCVLEKHCRETLCAGEDIEADQCSPAQWGKVCTERALVIMPMMTVCLWKWKWVVWIMEGRMYVMKLWASNWYIVNVFARVKWQGAGQEVCLLQCKNWCYGFLPGIKTLRTLRDTDTLCQGLNPVPKENIILFLFSFLIAAWFWNILHFPVLLAPLSQAPFSRQS